MKKLFFSTVLIAIASTAFAQTKFYATVFDEDNSPVARGFFKSAADSGIVLIVDKMEVLIYAIEITTLKIEKNPSKTEFLKLGTATATEVASFLVNNHAKKETTDSTITDDQVVNLSTETRDALFQRIQALVQNLMMGTNDVASFTINNSQEKFATKLRLLQEYSMEKEVVAMNTFSNNENVQSTIEQTEEISPQADSTNKPKVHTLNRGFFVIKKPAPTNSAKPSYAKPSVASFQTTGTKPTIQEKNVKHTQPNTSSSFVLENKTSPKKTSVSGSRVTSQPAKPKPVTSSTLPLKQNKPVVIIKKTNG